MTSTSNFSRAVTSAVACGVGVGAVALGWLGWKAFAKIVALINPLVDQSNDEQANIVSIDVPFPSDFHDVQEDWYSVYPPDNDEECKAAREQHVAGDDIDIDLSPLFDPILPAVEEDDLPTPAQTFRSIEDAELPESEPACDQLPPVSIQQEVVVDFASHGEESVQEAKDGRVPYHRARKPNRALWNQCYQRRLLKRANERALKTALDQECMSSLYFLQDSVLKQPLPSVKAESNKVSERSGENLAPALFCASSLVFLQESCIMDLAFDFSLLIEEDASLAPDQMNSSIEAIGLSEPTSVCEKPSPVTIPNETVDKVSYPEDEESVQEVFLGAEIAAVPDDDMREEMLPADFLAVAVEADDKVSAEFPTPPKISVPDVTAVGSNICSATVQSQRYVYDCNISWCDIVDSEDEE